jgi:hypothetical protein
MYDRDNSFLFSLLLLLGIRFSSHGITMTLIRIRRKSQIAEHS